MSHRYRGDRGALVALGLILGAIAFVALLVAARDYVSSHYAAKSGEQNYAGSNEDVAAIFDALMNFDPLDDTIAQWIMAGTGIVATLASIGALAYLRWTLLETRRIGQSQVMAYLSIERGRYRCTAGHIILTFAIRNSGASPALNVWIVPRIRYDKFAPERGNIAIDRFDFTLRGSGPYTVPANTTRKITALYSPHDAVEMVEFCDEVFEGKSFKLGAAIQWNDVFLHSRDVHHYTSHLLGTAKSAGRIPPGPDGEPGGIKGKFRADNWSPREKK